MKILMVNKFLYPRGGAETYFLKLGEQLNKEGHEVIYFGMSDPKNTVGNPEGLYTEIWIFMEREQNVSCTV